MSIQSPPNALPKSLIKDQGTRDYFLKQRSALYLLWTRLGKENGVVVDTHTPATASSTGKKGTITYDSSYIYVCVDTDTWERVAISTW